MKTCTKCKEQKSLSEFYKSSNHKDGVRSYCKSCSREMYLNWKYKDPDHAKSLWVEASKRYYTPDKGRQSRYGLAQETYLAMVESQDRKCKVCGDETDLVVDHNHKTSEIRGLLCNPCNKGLGHFRDSPEILERAIIYLAGG